MILIVDDSATQRRMLARTLSKAGYCDGTEFSSAKDLLDELCDEAFVGRVSLILLDNHRPNIDGINAYKSLKKTT